MKRVLIVEDQTRDLHIAAGLARDAGFCTADARTSAMAAKLYLENGLRDEGPLPDAIILDLDLGYESGFELMRFWHSNPRLSSIPLIVWTVLGDEQSEICRLFKVSAYVSKLDDPAHLSKALGNLLRAAS